VNLSLTVPVSIDPTEPDLTLEVEWQKLIPADRYSPEEGGYWLPVPSSIRRVDGLATHDAIEDWLLTAEFLDAVQERANHVHGD